MEEGLVPPVSVEMWIGVILGAPVILLGMLRILWHGQRGGIYAWRTDKPHAFIGLPMIGRHWAYVGLTNSYYHRSGQHLRGSEVYGTKAASWSDLRPKCYKIFPMPSLLTHGALRRAITLEKMETLFIRLLFPVYNEKKQWKFNPRKVSRAAAARERARRDELGSLYRLVKFALRWIVIGFIIVVSYTAYVKGWIG